MLVITILCCYRLNYYDDDDGDDDGNDDDAPFWTLGFCAMIIWKLL